MAETLQRFLDSGGDHGDHKALGNREELCEAVDRVTAYRDFQPQRFDRRQANRQLQSLRQDRMVTP